MKTTPKALEPYVDVKALAEFFGVTPKWVRKYAPVIPHVRVGRGYRFRLSEADTWYQQWRGGVEV